MVVITGTTSTGTILVPHVGLFTVWHNTPLYHTLCTKTLILWGLSGRDYAKTIHREIRGSARGCDGFWISNSRCCVNLSREFFTVLLLYLWMDCSERSPCILNEQRTCPTRITTLIHLFSLRKISLHQRRPLLRRKERLRL